MSRSLIFILILVLLIITGCGKTYEDTATRGEDYSLKLGSFVEIDMVWIPEGTFLMGSPESDFYRGEDECPQVSVDVGEFWIGKYEITESQYEIVMGSKPSDNGDDYPVDYVTWSDAMEFCERLSELAGVGYTLPTEEQWEYACRAGSRSDYCFGNDQKELRNYAWFYVSGGENRPNPVGELRPNAWGLYDMHGNVGEWTRSFYTEKLGVEGVAGERPRYVTRGGSYMDSSDCVRSASRGSMYVDWPAFESQGFRIVRNP